MNLLEAKNTPRDLVMPSLRGSSTKLPKVIIKPMLAIRTAILSTFVSAFSLASMPQVSAEEHGKDFHVGAGFAFFPGQGGKYGVDVELGYPLGDEERVHLELVLCDIGFAVGSIPINTPIPGSLTSISQSEFHIGAGVGLSVPLNESVEFSAGVGLGLGVFQHGGATIGADANGEVYALNASSRTAALAMFDASVGIQITDRLHWFAKVAPHITIGPMPEGVQNPLAPQYPSVDVPLISGLALSL